MLFVQNLFSFLSLYFSSSPEATSTMDLAMGFPGGSDGKETACNAGDSGSIPGLGRSPGEGNGNPLQYSCLGNPMDRRAWRATVHGVTKSWARPLFTLCLHFHHVHMYSQMILVLFLVVFPLH